MAKPKEPKEPKSREARAREAEMIRTQLADLGFPTGASDIWGALDEFVDMGFGLTRAWKFGDLGVEVMLLLSTQPRVTSYARVRRLR